MSDPIIRLFYILGGVYCIFGLVRACKFDKIPYGRSSKGIIYAVRAHNAGLYFSVVGFHVLMLLVFIYFACVD